MNLNFSALIDAGLLSANDLASLSKDVLASLTDQDVHALTQMKANMAADLFKHFNEFILP